MIFTNEDIYQMIKNNEVWVFCDEYDDYSKPGNKIAVFERIIKTKKELYITKFKNDKDTFGLNLNPRNEIRLENHKLENNVHYVINFKCNIDHIKNANFFQILNRDENGNAYPVFQLEKRGDVINSRERFNGESKREKRLSFIKHKNYDFDIEFKSGKNGIILLKCDKRTLLEYYGKVDYQVESWIQLGVYGDRNEDSTLIFQSLEIKKKEEVITKLLLNLELSIQNNKVIKVDFLS